MWHLIWIHTICSDNCFLTLKLVKDKQNSTIQLVSKDLADSSTVCLLWFKEGQYMGGQDLAQEHRYWTSVRHLTRDGHLSDGCQMSGGYLVQDGPLKVILPLGIKSLESAHHWNWEDIKLWARGSLARFWALWSRESQQAKKSLLQRWTKISHRKEATEERHSWVFNDL